MQSRRSVFLALCAVLALMTTLTVGSVAAASPNATQVYRLVLTGDQEATPTCEPPAVCGDPDAVGQMILIVNPNNDTVCFVTRWTGIDGTVTAAHIHRAPEGDPGPVVVPLFTGPLESDDAVRDCVPGMGLTDDINADPENYYVNIHSSPNFGPGAIRAQLA